ncbi:class I adenylate-forming enzyme family protein [Mycobacterium sp. BMJ-28]
MKSLNEVLASAADRFGAAIAVEDADGALTYADLADRVQRLARGLRDQALTPGSPVLVLLPNSVAAIEVDLALAVAGLVRVALNPRLGPDEWNAIRLDCQAAALIVDPRIEGAPELVRRTAAPTYVSAPASVHPDSGRCSLEDLITATTGSGPALPTPHPESLCALHYSSGTTGTPKGAQRTHANRLSSLHAMRRHVLAPTLDPTQPAVFLHAGPVIHTSGLFVLPILELGGRQVLLDHPRPTQIIDAVSTTGATHTALVPTVVARLLDFDDHTLAPLRGLRMLAYAGAPMPAEHIRQAHRRITPNLVQYYGMVEAIPPLTVLDAAAHRRGITEKPELLASAGTPCDGVHIEFHDDHGPVPDGAIGELVVSGPAVSAGYHNPDGREDLAKTHIGGQLRSGDLGFRSLDGYIYLTGRNKDMIITGGYNVYPREVEEAIAGIEGVADVVVVGLPDSLWGQRIVVGFTVAPDATVTDDQVLARSRQRLSDFKRPKAVHRLVSLPLTAMGKVDRTQATLLLAAYDRTPSDAALLSVPCLTEKPQDAL